MASSAKLFQNGNSQAVRLPKEFRFINQSEVLIQKVDGGVLLTSKNVEKTWDNIFENIDKFSQDFIENLENRKDLPQNREKLF